jgi:hypothetical protein
MAFVVFGITYVFTILIQTAVGMLAVGERLRAFKAVSPGMLPRARFSRLQSFTATTGSPRRSVWQFLRPASPHPS